MDRTWSLRSATIIAASLVLAAPATAQTKLLRFPDIHGETVVAKFLARKGPSGWYSQAWMSRADQSLSRASPKTCPSASAIGTGSPSALPVPTQMPISSS